MALADEVADLKKRLDDLEAKNRVVREVRQVVFDREGTEVKVRARVLLKTATGVEEKWEEVTGKFTKPEEVLNGA